ncbi:DUF4870 domain-containing protein [Rathayibacter toxicus]|uniref:DUF4870 domain-containing protein n=1 Tax=Rathayibacter toxicus TaxID=145458 RepID=A0A0C5BH31_9MICO|nr:DUF4870 domain-containing protein [Rathayibacter toxicus]AJM77500.1 hypothetical protein TI83_05185 [Rathayibacter toxicus]ALS56589.1 hypothetical protein APU90_01290 [Rathayibacter toxicus]KKM44681.1 hypothetical protein VT73_09255 [Rathayibacter toxicus]PPG21586.1 DUF4870 domain-containing protein [Rathayibacter toxicus]PPG46548.1 DUF4870 domain-containing protein [Rathayibacter toxicus]
MSATPPPYETQAPPLNPADEKTWAVVTHVLGIFFSFLPSLIVFLVFKGRGPFLEAHAKTALNFQLTTLIAYAAGTILAFVLIGFVVFIVVPILVLIFSIIAAVKASAGEYYKYPLSIPFFS